MIVDGQFNLAQEFVSVVFLYEPTHHPWGHSCKETQTTEIFVTFSTKERHKIKHADSRWLKMHVFWPPLNAMSLYTFHLMHVCDQTYEVCRSAKGFILCGVSHHSLHQYVTLLTYYIRMTVLCEWRYIGQQFNIVFNVYVLNVYTYVSKCQFK